MDVLTSVSLQHLLNFFFFFLMFLKTIISSSEYSYKAADALISDERLNCSCPMRP